MRRLLTVVTFVASLSAQTFNARLTGIITDPALAAVPNSTVTALAVATQTKKVATTDSTGTFNIPLLLPGTY